MVVISGGAPQNDFWGHFDQFSRVLYRDDFYSSTHVSASAIDTKPKVSGKFAYVFSKLFWEFGLSIYCRSRDIGFFVKSFAVNKSLFSDFFQRQKPYISALTVDRESKPSEKVVNYVRKLSWKFQPFRYRGSGNIRLLIQKFDSKMKKRNCLFQSRRFN